MKKIFLCVGLLFAGIGMNSIYAQQSVELHQKSLLTAIKPVDGNPVVFSNQVELESNVGFKIENVKQLILENQNDAIKVRQLREELWRFENAIVQERKQLTNAKNRIK